MKNSPQGEQLCWEGLPGRGGGGDKKGFRPQERGGRLPGRPIWAQPLPGPRRPQSLPGPSLCPDGPFPRPSGPPRRKPSSGENPWRSCCCTNVSGGRQPVPLPALSLPLSCLPLPGQSATGPGEAAIPSLWHSQVSLLLGEAEPWPRPLVWPWSWLLPAPPCPWELALPVRGRWDLCANTHIPRIITNISTY